MKALSADTRSARGLSERQFDFFRFIFVVKFCLRSFGGVSFRSGEALTVAGPARFLSVSRLPAELHQSALTSSAAVGWRWTLSGGTCRGSRSRRLVKAVSAKRQLLRQRTDEMIHTLVEPFAKLTGVKQRAHALSHFAEHTFGQIVLNRSAESREGSLFVDCQYEQQTLFGTCASADVPILRHLQGKLCDVLAAGGLNYSDVKFDARLLVLDWQDVFQLLPRLFIEYSGEIIDVSCGGRQLFDLGELSYAKRQKQSRATAGNQNPVHSLTRFFHSSISHLDSARSGRYWFVVAQTVSLRARWRPFTIAD